MPGVAKDYVPGNTEKWFAANLVVVQWGVVAERTDRGQLHQGIILGTLDCFSIMVPKQQYIMDGGKKELVRWPYSGEAIGVWFISL